jgi:hypothetical protein
MSSESRISYFPQPAYRIPRLDRDDSRILTPSDLRRLRDASHTKLVSSSANGVIGVEVEKITAKNATSSLAIAAAHDTYNASSTTEPVASKDPNEAVGAFSLHSPPGNGSRPQQPAEDDQASDNEWRQTPLQRRSFADLMAEPRTESPPMANCKPEIEPPTSPVAAEVSAHKHAAEASVYQTSEVRNKTDFVGWMLEQERRNRGKEPDLDNYQPPIRPDAKELDRPSKDDIESEVKDKMESAGSDETYARSGVRDQESSSPGRSASDILRQLPNDDIDFLTAVDIRATMGTKRSRLPSDEERDAKKHKLAQAFVSTQQPGEDMDTTIESKIVNDQLVRRTERELRETERAHGLREFESSGKIPSQTLAAEPPLESSIERMKKWLETTGASFARQFWQGPTEEADVTRNRLFFDRLMQYVQKGRLAMRPIVEDLEKDIPASAALLKRLKSDEDLLKLAILQLRQRSSNGLAEGLAPRKIKAMESVKVRLHQTNQELEKAHVALRELANTDAVTKATGSFRRRLTMASQVLNKNTQLSRMLIYSLQTRVEDPDIERKILSNYRAIADNLLSLRDTQLTLLRLVDHAISIYGVVPEIKDIGDSGDLKRLGGDHANCDEPFIHARLAADAHLFDQINATKPDLQAAEAPKPTPRACLDDSGPLANCLFRPFGANTISKDDTTAEAEAKQKLGDLRLIEDVDKVYEDTYRDMIVDRQQNAPVLEESIAGGDATVKKFNMLKEDPTATDHEATSTHSETNTSSKAEREDSVSPNETLRSNEANHMRNLPYPPLSKEAALNEVGALLGYPTVPASSTIPEVSSTAASTSATAHSSRQYTILVHDLATDELSMTTTTRPPHETSPTLPLHQALQALDNPAKFMPFITPDVEVLTARKDMLILRQAVNTMADNDLLEKFDTQPNSCRTGGPVSQSIFLPPRNPMNPIDGTARLSPTGYAGPEDSPEQLAKEFNERRAAARNMRPRGLNEVIKQHAAIQRKKEKHKKGGVVRVVQTGIWAAAVCYVFGVLGEVVAVGGA